MRLSYSAVQALEPRRLLCGTHADPAMQAEHDALMALIPASGTGANAPTHYVAANVSSGNWSSAGTWSTGTVPDANSIVYIAPGKTVTVNTTTAAAKRVRADGTLRFQSNVNTQLSVDTIVIGCEGTYEMGTNAAPITASAKVIFNSTGAIDTAWDPRMLSRGLVVHGATSIVGLDKTDWVSTGNITTSATSITLDSAPVGWANGDRLVITGTQSTGTGSVSTGFNSQDEVRTVSSLSGATLGISSTLGFAKTVEPGYGFKVYIANLTRNVSFETAGWSSLGSGQADVLRRAHIMFMHNDQVVVKNASFTGLGRTNKAQVVTDPNGTGGGLANPRGRYAVHLHRVGDQPADPYVQIEGNAVENSPGWGIVVHESKANVISNASYDVRGAHYVTETGTEQSSFIDNIAIKGTGINRADWVNLLQLDDSPRGIARDLGERGLGFWFQKSGSIREVRGNVVAGMFGAGMIVWGVSDDTKDEEPLLPVAGLPAALQALFPGRTMVEASMVPIDQFSDNIVMNSRGYMDIRGHMRNDTGFDWGDHYIGGTDRSQTIKHFQPGVVDDASGWRLWEYGIHIPYAAHVTLNNPILLGNLQNPIQRTGQAPTEPDGAGVHLQKNARYITLNNPTLGGWGFGTRVGQTGSQGYGDRDEEPLGGTTLIAGTFLNNTYHFMPADGRLTHSPQPDPGNLLDEYLAPFTPFFNVVGTPTFTVNGGASNAAPTAAFSSAFRGGRVVRFNASASTDDHPILGPSYDYQNGTRLNDNTIPIFLWDFNNDGTPDASGRFVEHRFTGTNTSQNVKLTVIDSQGKSAAVTQSVSISGTASNLVNDGSFANTNGFNSPTSSRGWWYTPFILQSSANLLSSALSGQNYGGKDTQWFHYANGSAWSYDAANDRASTNATGTRTGIAQIIHNDQKHTGTATFSFTLGGSTVNMRAQVYGINGRFQTRADQTSAPTSAGGSLPFASTTLLDQTYTTGGAKTESLSLGANGFDFYLIRFHRVGTVGGQTLDNVSLTSSGSTAPATPEATIALTHHAAEPSTNGLFTVTLNPAPPANVTVNLTRSGSASNGTDYQSIPLTVTVGTSGTATIPLTVIDDSIIEGTETVVLTLASGTGYTVGGANAASANITDNDSAATAYTESFTNAAALSGSWSNGSFSGDSGLTFNYTQARSGTQTGAAMRLKSNSAGFVEWTVADGVVGLSVFVKSGNSTTPTSVTLRVDGTVVATSPTFNSTGGTWTVPAMSFGGTRTIRLTNVGTVDGVIDSIDWAPAGLPLVGPRELSQVVRPVVRVGLKPGLVEGLLTTPGGSASKRRTDLVGLVELGNPPAIS
jgi:hypothetical protein